MSFCLCRLRCSALHYCFFSYSVCFSVVFLSLGRAPRACVSFCSYPTHYCRLQQVWPHTHLLCVNTTYSGLIIPALSEGERETTPTPSYRMLPTTGRGGARQQNCREVVLQVLLVVLLSSFLRLSSPHTLHVLHLMGSAPATGYLNMAQTHIYLVPGKASSWRTQNMWMVGPFQRRLRNFE